MGQHAECRLSPLARFTSAYCRVVADIVWLQREIQPLRHKARGLLPLPAILASAHRRAVIDEIWLLSRTLATIVFPSFIC